MAEDGKDPKPKIVVDEDWKSQAQAEKEKLAQTEQQAAEHGGAGAEELPPASFAALVSNIVAQALFALGAIAEPRTGKRYRDLGLAKHQIDLLSMLEEKTRGNLTEQEKKMLDNALYEVRMAYVQLAQQGG